VVNEEETHTHTHIHAITSDGRPSHADLWHTHTHSSEFDAHHSRLDEPFREEQQIHA
jgi:hypothetical protein